MQQLSLETINMDRILRKVGVFNASIQEAELDLLQAIVSGAGYQNGVVNFKRDLSLVQETFGDSAELIDQIVDEDDVFLALNRIAYDNFSIKVIDGKVVSIER